jgi:hypothetical protein
MIGIHTLFYIFKAGNQGPAFLLPRLIRKPISPTSLNTYKVDAHVNNSTIITMARTDLLKPTQNIQRIVYPSQAVCSRVAAFVLDLSQIVSEYQCATLEFRKVKQIAYEVYHCVNYVQSHLSGPEPSWHAYVTA